MPFTCKEAFGFKGFKQTGGLVRRKNTVANENAVIVQKMLDAGAILLATTNVSELCMWWESSNYVYGTSRNPYDTKRIVGGSSGGEGAIIAAAGSVIGIGSGKTTNYFCVQTFLIDVSGYYALKINFQILVIIILFLTSDIGGSIRMPAFFNGVFGHKASPGMVSNSGQFPVNDTDACNLLLASGPLCRYAVDLTLMLKVIYQNRLSTK